MSPYEDDKWIYLSTVFVPVYMIILLVYEEITNKTAASAKVYY